jgi:hypothetical protein
MKKFIIFDNGGQTVDRFTIINKETGDIFGCSDTPNAPGCAGGLIGNCVSHRIIVCGAGWRQRLPGKNIIKEEVDNYVNNARLDPDWLGREVDLINLPMNVKHFISRLAPDTHPGDSPKVNIVYMSPGSETVSSGSRR